MGLIDEAMASEASPAAHARKHPPGWEPHVEENGDRATAVSEPTDQPNPDHEALIRGWQLDPAVWRIVGNINVRRWQTYDERWLYYYKADLERIDPQYHADVQALLSRIQKHKPPKREPRVGDDAFVPCVGDTQIGKGDGDGTEGTVNRILTSLDATADRLRKRPVSLLVISFLGDLIEGCTGNYAAQKFTTDLTRREQESVMQELVWLILKRLAPLAPRVLVPVVPGNHGENRDGGQMFTLPADNSDIAIVETVHRGIRRNENHAFDHVAFMYPESQELTVTADIAGVSTVFAHGHQFKRGSTPAQKAENWWKDQAHGDTLAGSASLLISGHYHHLLVGMGGRKTHIQIPSLDGGSVWWENQTGQSSPPGMTSLFVGEGLGPQGCGWEGLEVL